MPLESPSAGGQKADEIKLTLKESGYDEIQGDVYKAVVSTKLIARLDTKLVRNFLTPAEVDACTRESTSVSVSLYDL